jgi:hypothetical protein
MELSAKAWLIPDALISHAVRLLLNTALILTDNSMIRGMPACIR